MTGRDGSDGDPIFVVGCPRSGTSILQNALRFHPDVAWVTPATNMLTGTVSNRGWSTEWIVRLAPVLDPVAARLPARLRPSALQGPFDGAFADDAIPVAVEGKAVWIRGTPTDRGHDRWTAEDATPEVRAHYRAVERAHLDRFGASRWLSKRPKNALRLPFLQAVFPDARFVHIVRDGRDVCASIVKRKRNEGHPWFGAQPPGWRDLADASDVVQAGWQWRTVLETVREDERGLLDPGQVVHVRYEDLTADPETVLEDLLVDLGLDPAGFRDAAGDHLEQIQARRGDWRTRFSARELELLREEIGGTMDAWGYAWDELDVAP